MGLVRGCQLNAGDVSDPKSWVIHLSLTNESEGKVSQPGHEEDLHEKRMISPDDGSAEKVLQLT